MRRSTNFKVALLATCNMLFWASIAVSTVALSRPNISIEVLVSLLFIAGVFTWATIYWLVHNCVKPITCITNDIERMNQTGSVVPIANIYGVEYEALLVAVNKAMRLAQGEKQER